MDGFMTCCYSKYPVRGNKLGLQWNTLTYTLPKSICLYTPGIPFKHDEEISTCVRTPWIWFCSPNHQGIFLAGCATLGHWTFWRLTLLIYKRKIIIPHRFIYLSWSIYFQAWARTCGHKDKQGPDPVLKAQLLLIKKKTVAIIFRQRKWRSEKAEKLSRATWLAKVPNLRLGWRPLPSNQCCFHYIILLSFHQHSIKYYEYSILHI